MTVDASSAIAENEKLVKAFQKVKAELRDLKKESRQSEKIELEKMRIAERAAKEKQKQIEAEVKAHAAGLRKKDTAERQAKADMQRRINEAKALQRKLIEDEANDQAKALSKKQAMQERADLRQKRALEQAHQQQSAFLGMGISRAATFIASLFGVRQAINAMRTEYQSAIELQDKAATEQITLAGSRKQLVRNISDLDPGERKRKTDEALKATSALSLTTGVEEKVLNTSLAETLSATGGDLVKSLEVLALTARYIKDQPEQFGLASGATSDLLKTFNGDASAKSALGLFAYLGGQSRVTGAQQQATNIPQAVSGAMAQGATQAEAVNMFAVLSRQMDDKKGEQTRTSQIRFFESLREFVNESKTLQRAAGGSELTGGEIIGYLQANQSEAKKFLDGASFEALAAGPIKKLLTDPESNAAKDYFEQSAKPIPSTSALEQLAEEMIAAIEGVPGAEIANVKDAGNVGQERILGKNDQAKIGAAREALMKNVTADNGQNFIGNLVERAVVRSIFEIRTMAGQDANKVSAEILESQSAALKRGRRANVTQYGDLGAISGLDTSPEIPPTESELFVAQGFESLAADLRANTAATEANTAAMNTAAPTSSTPVNDAAPFRFIGKNANVIEQLIGANGDSE